MQVLFFFLFTSTTYVPNGKPTCLTQSSELDFLVIVFAGLFLVLRLWCSLIMTSSVHFLSLLFSFV